MAQGSNKTSDADADTITLGVLTAIEEDDRATQRAISEDLGIALGLTNAYLKRCVKKGFIKVRQIPANRYAYYLTPQGFAEKSQGNRFWARETAMGFEMSRIIGEDGNRRYFVLFMFLFRAAETPKAIALREK